MLCGTVAFVFIGIGWKFNAIQLLEQGPVVELNSVVALVDHVSVDVKRYFGSHVVSLRWIVE